MNINTCIDKQCPFVPYSQKTSVVRRPIAHPDARAAACTCASQRPQTRPSARDFCFGLDGPNNEQSGKKNRSKNAPFSSSMDCISATKSAISNAAKWAGRSIAATATSSPWQKRQKPIRRTTTNNAHCSTGVAAHVHHIVIDGQQRRHLCNHRMAYRCTAVSISMVATVMHPSMAILSHQQPYYCPPTTITHHTITHQQPLPTTLVPSSLPITFLPVHTYLCFQTIGRPDP